MNYPKNVTSIILEHIAEVLHKIARRLFDIALKIRLKACQRCSERFTCDLWDKFRKMKEVAENETQEEL